MPLCSMIALRPRSVDIGRTHRLGATCNVLAKFSKSFMTVYAKDHF